MANYTAITRITISADHRVQPLVRHTAVTIEASSFDEALAEAKQAISQAGTLRDGSAHELVALGLTEHVGPRV